MSDKTIMWLDVASAYSGVAITCSLLAGLSKAISPGVAMSLVVAAATVPAICVSWRCEIERQTRK